MSYDISLKVKVQDKPVYVQVTDEVNITYNVHELIKQSSGWEIKNNDNNGNIFEWVEKIKHGIKELETHPELYKQYEARNGWGTVEDTLHFYYQCLDMFEEFLEWHGQGDEDDLTDVTVVWVD